jgi:hypothetical protein
MPLSIIDSNDKDRRSTRTLDFDSLNCGNFMNSFLTISATLKPKIDGSENGQLEIEVTNDGHALIGDFYLYISLEKRSDTEFEKTIPRTLEIRKKVQKITRGQCLIFTLLIEPNQLKESNIISVWAQASKRTYLNSKLCVDILL